MRWAGLGVLALVTVLLLAKRAVKNATMDLGSVSEQWIAQHRRESYTTRVLTVAP